MMRRWVPCVAILIMLTFAGRVAAEEGLVFDKNASSEADLLAARQRVLRQMLTSSYHKIRKNNAKFEEPVAHCIDSYVAIMAPGATPEQRRAVLNEALGLLGQGCDNGVIHHIAGHMAVDLKKYDLAWTQLGKAGEGYYKKGAHPTFLVSISMLTFDVLIARKQGDRGFLARQIMENLKASMADPSYKNDPRVLLWDADRVLMGYPSDAMAAVYNAIKGNNKVDPWIKEVIAGRMYAKRAREQWDGKAPKDAQDHWKDYAGNLDEASQHLIRAWELKPDAPEAAADMITVAMDGRAPEGQTPRLWFERAIAAQADYKPAYMRMRWALRPDWGGSVEELLAFGEACAATKRYDIDIPIHYISAIEELLLCSELDHESIYMRPGVYERVQAMYDGYLAAKTPFRAREMIMALKTSVAWRCRRWEDAARFFKEIPTDFEGYDEAFRFVSGETKPALAEIMAHAPPYDAKTKAAERLVAQGRLGDAEAVYQGALNAADTDPLVRTYFKHRTVSLGRLRTFIAGEWVDLTLDADKAGWTQRMGKWSVEEDGSIVGKADRNGLQLVSDLPVGDRFELTCEFDFDPKYKKEHNVGILFDDAGPDHNDMILFFIGRKWASVMSPFHPPPKGPIDSFPAPIESAANRLHVRVYDGRIWATLNDKSLFGARKLASFEGERLEKHHIALGAMSGNNAFNFTVKFRNVRIRQLDAPPGQRRKP